LCVFIIGIFGKLFFHQEATTMLKLLLASGNKGKLKEIQSLLADLHFLLLTPADVGLSTLEVIESGHTYAENAALKAQAFAQASGLLSIADDSGLEVDALGGAPGIYSARYSPKPQATDADRRVYLLEQLQGHPHPWTARFRCVIALQAPDGFAEIVEGVCPGEIIAKERGDDGFGYDPIFLLPSLGRTMAELTMTEKNTISHRARAILAARPLLQKWSTLQN
jgi:XTP/dITP diphosphohydrolase